MNLQLRRPLSRIGRRSSWRAQDGAGCGEIDIMISEFDKFVLAVSNEIPRPILMKLYLSYCPLLCTCVYITDKQLETPLIWNSWYEGIRIQLTNVGLVFP